MSKLELKIESEPLRVEVNLIVLSKIIGQKDYLEQSFFMENFSIKDFELMLSAKHMKHLLLEVLEGKLRPREYESEYKVLKDFLDSVD